MNPFSAYTSLLCSLAEFQFRFVTAELLNEDVVQWNFATSEISVRNIMARLIRYSAASVGHGQTCVRNIGKGNSSDGLIYLHPLYPRSQLTLAVHFMV